MYFTFTNARFYRFQFLQIQCDQTFFLSIIFFIGTFNSFFLTKNFFTFLSDIQSSKINPENITSILK